ncbi:hypothetical protein [Streptomyces sp. NPDC001508]|uniref:hypothetical protein n=1 Tax=Streptomyces sp. NPDC001508 TaxID=3154656 RepID=UPI0033290066
MTEVSSGFITAGLEGTAGVTSFHEQVAADAVPVMRRKGRLQVGDGVLHLGRRPGSLMRGLAGTLSWKDRQRCGLPTK